MHNRRHAYIRNVFTGTRRFKMLRTPASVNLSCYQSTFVRGTTNQYFANKGPPATNVFRPGV